MKLLHWHKLDKWPIKWPCGGALHHGGEDPPKYGVGKYEWRAAVQIRHMYPAEPALDKALDF